MVDMKKIVMATVLALSVGATAFADRYNPYDDMFKTQSVQERRMGVAQCNYLLKDENSAPVGGAVLTYVNWENRQMTATADGQGRVHLEFTQPGFVQLVSVKIGGVEYRVIGDDLSDDISYKDVGKGKVEYYVLQRNSANRAMYVFDAD